MKISIEKAGYTGKVFIGMDVAASEFYTEKDKKYDLKFKEEVVLYLVLFVPMHSVCFLLLLTCTLSLYCEEFHCQTICMQ